MSDQIAPTLEQPAKPPARRRVNRADSFVGGLPLAVVAILVTLGGFWPTFFSRLDEVDAAHMLHGMLATGWLVLVLVQASLIGIRKPRWHRVLGWLSLPWFVLLVVTSCHMIILMMSATGGLPIPFEQAKIFGFSDVTALPLLIIAYVGAIILRKDRHVHSRLMSITLLAGLLPAVARFFYWIMVAMGLARVESVVGLDGLTEVRLEGLALAMHPTFVFVLLALAIAIFFDWKNSRLRWPFLFAFAWLAINYATFFPGMSSQWFDSVARAIAALA
jgi:hypothetical protein